MAYIGAGVTRFNTADELTVTGDATIDTTTLVVDSTNNRVGIGTSSPSDKLTLDSGQMRLSDNYGIRWGTASTAIYGSAGAGTLQMYTNSSERMRIDSGGNVGIGLSSSLSGLNVNNSIRSQNSASNISYMGFTSYTGTTAAGAMYSYMGGDGRNTGYLNFSTNDTERMRIDSSGNVGIGTSSPSSLLDVDQSQDAETNIELTNTNTGSSAQVRTKYTTDGGLFTVGKTSNAHPYGGDAYIYNVDNTNLRFATSDTERLRIDSSGNLLVGTTSTGVATLTSGGGSVISSAGASAIAYQSVNSTDPVLLLNNTGVDGAIVEFRKDGSPVGSIGVTAGGVDTYIGKGTTGLRFYDGSNTDGGTGIIVPWNTSTNAARDAQMNLGSSSERYRNLYLSGGVYLGGTTSANLLDDYEEGTWTVTLTPSVSGTISYAAGGGASYTKIGQVVHISISVTNNSSSSPNGYISFNLPFVAASGSQKGRSALALYLDGVSSNNVADFIGLTIDGASEGRIYLGDDGAAQPDSAQQMDGSCYILISGSYITSA